VLTVKEERMLVEDSLQETLWRLEEARQGFRSPEVSQVEEALEWILSRQGLPGSYSGLFLPTSLDLSRGVQLLTGERFPSRNVLTRHVLGEEALRTIMVWKRDSSEAGAGAVKGFDRILERGGKTGFYCCYTCTLSFLRTLTAVKPEGWEGILERGINRIKDTRTPDGRWHGFSFYYTLLTLSEADKPAAQTELKHARKTAEKLLKRNSRNDRTSLFRRLGLNAALNAV
jgi:hypothetical protein